jgi:prophage regulatory protein
MFYKVTEVSRRYQVPPATIWRWTREARFPQPVKLGLGTTRWREEDRCSGSMIPDTNQGGNVATLKRGVQ